MMPVDLVLSTWGQKMTNQLAESFIIDSRATILPFCDDSLTVYQDTDYIPSYSRT